MSNNNRCENCIIRHLNSLKVLDKEHLSIISDAKKVVSFNKGQLIFEEGEKLKGLYCIKSGNPKLSKLSENGKDHIVRIASKGELLGKRSVIANTTTNLSAIALNKMEVCFIPQTNISELINKKSFIKSLLINMTKDLKIADNTIVNMAQKKVIQRIAQVLLYLKNNFGTDEEEFLNLILSREDISSVVGCAKEACIRIISKLKKEKIIYTSRKKIKILDIRKLISYSNQN